jgi:hypothetical protein
MALLALAGCSTTHPSDGANAGSETVLVTYHVQSGKEDEFQKLLTHAWEVYQADGLVYEKPHIVVRNSEDDNKTCFTEVFTWAKSPDHPSADVSALWKQESSLCEARDGHRGIEGGEVDLVTGK